MPENCLKLIIEESGVLQKCIACGVLLGNENVQASQALRYRTAFFFFVIRARSICPGCTAAYKAYCATLIPPRDLDVPTSAARCLHIHTTREILAAKGGTCEQEYWPVILSKCQLTHYI